MVHHSNARIKTLKTYILDRVARDSWVSELSDVKRDGTVFIRFRSTVEFPADVAVNAFRSALDADGIAYDQTDANKFRLALDQFDPFPGAISN